MNLLADKKWQKFLKRSRIFKHIPFLSFSFAAGSLAMGNLHENSDFDVIIGTRTGRIFTTRAACILIFGILGWRRTMSDEHGNKTASDKFCFSHFVAPAAYRLSPPYNEYWKRLYGSIVPIYGDEKLIQDFFNSNADWIGARREFEGDKKYLGDKKSILKVFLEWILSARMGDWLEIIAENIQIAKIKRSFVLVQKYKPRIIVNKNELEFHPNTKRAEEISFNLTKKA